jgi:peptide/nickel transport system substrate-binding protein
MTSTWHRLGRLEKPSPQRRRRNKRTATAAVLFCVVALGLAACGSTTPTSSATSGKPISGGTVSYAMQAGDYFSWMFPLENTANDEPYDEWVENEMWRPLYYPGGPGTTGIDYTLSLAAPPVYSNNDTTVTITLKKGYRWSDGQPVTSSDVQFYFQLEAAGAKNGKFATYVPGDLPDDLASVTYSGPYQFTLHLKHSYNPVWFTGNQLTWLYALPRQVWDKTCATCTVGNDAATESGANNVYNFLYGQSEKLSTYAANPLWKTVDGPWVISSFNPTTYETVLVANKKYTGPDKPHLSKLNIFAFPSDTAELDALRSGTIQFGWLPLSDVPAKSTYESLGYTFKPEYAFYTESIELGYTSKQWGPLVRQLYIRQALQHLVDEPLYINTAYHGYGVLDYGVAPDLKSPYVAPALRTDPYPYSISAAKVLLSAHGWIKGPSGIDLCERPGTASDECGAGITKGEPLSILFMYSTGSPSFLAQVEAFVTTARTAGIAIPLDGQSETTMYSIAGVCPPGPCNYGMAGYFGFFWDYGQDALVPDAGQWLGKHNYWGGGYNSAMADGLITQARTASAGFSALYTEQTYLTKQVAALWFPVPAQALLLVKNDLKGWESLNPYDFPMPSQWYYVR